MPSSLSDVAKSPVRVERFDCLKFEPRFEYGHMAEVSVTAGEQDGAELGTGFARFSHARIPWTIQYDEVLIVFEGTLRVHCGGDIHELGPRDSLWLPAGTELIYESESALVAYAIHPSNWNSGD